ncbi:hypothetical protein FIBSPDRAFT_883713 [Athelia psychrophila]|uniref:Uncharacterized protein n=1 Tax=Athelia psychrophila TaxID=1759441 RepID=A0A166TUY8_9AGAM|nr:hypothetical protein FIBSPDRAFT_883713 [Fibularhizoctonia sp. CBS 109695]
MGPTNIIPRRQRNFTQHRQDSTETTSMITGSLRWKADHQHLQRDSLLATPLILDLTILAELHTRVRYKAVGQKEFVPPYLGSRFDASYAAALTNWRRDDYGIRAWLVVQNYCAVAQHIAEILAMGCPDEMKDFSPSHDEIAGATTVMKVLSETRVAHAIEQGELQNARDVEWADVEARRADAREEKLDRKRANEEGSSTVDIPKRVDPKMKGRSMNTISRRRWVARSQLTISKEPSAAPSKSTTNHPMLRGLPGIDNAPEEMLDRECHAACTIGLEVDLERSRAWEKSQFGQAALKSVREFANTLTEWQVQRE